MRHAPLAAALSLGLAAMSSHAADAPDYALTVYSSATPGQISVEALTNYGMQVPGYALVRDARRMELPRGSGAVRFTDVAKRIDPTTVSFVSKTDPVGTRVIEQNFQFDLVSQEKLIARYIGETITVEQQRGDQLERVSGRLLSASGGLILEKSNGEVLTLNTWSNVAFPSLPGGLITKPTLVWLVDAKRGGTHDAEVAYQTQGMTWWADYNVTLHGDESACAIDLAAWVTVVNQSGGSFPNAQLKLVAGEVNRAPAAPQPAPMAKYAVMAAPPVADEGFQESQLFEYHLYTLGRRTDLPDNSTKQLELFPSAVGVDCRRQLVFTASPEPWRHWGAPILDQGYGATMDGKVGAFLEFENKESNRLGMPLPAGRVRVNQASVDGALEFIGEDLIQHTPRNETLRVKLGEAFDVVGERKQLSFAYDEGNRRVTERFEIEVRNRKRSAVRVTVREYLYRWSDWTITEQSQPHERRDAATADFVVDIPADGIRKVSYTVRYQW
ncbi:MAG: hypothetical protein LW860_04405 [Xanthomonadaceae bacterium]|jgi:hypothetical protein|nr:hypothetical protein [Xanthomonadaceae bacterium]